MQEKSNVLCFSLYLYITRDIHVINLINSGSPLENPKFTAPYIRQEIGNNPVSCEHQVIDQVIPSRELTYDLLLSKIIPDTTCVCLHMVLCKRSQQKSQTE